MKINVAGILIDNLSKREVLDYVTQLLRSQKLCYLVTPYSEQIVFALEDEEYKKTLNGAALALPDGIGVLWASKYLHSSDSLLKTLFAIIFNRPYIRSVIQEQITGSLFVYDLVRLAAENNFSLALVGGEGNVAAQSAYELKKLYPNLKVNLALSGRPFDEKIIQEIAASNSDILLIAYSPPKQEKWIAANLQKLNVKLAMGLGGTFDYIAGKRLLPPQFMRTIGLEWLWRLITQPWRIKRMWNAIPVFIWKIYMYKKNHVTN
ncbi:MAG: hypothetical protein A3C49_03545 [Candidatus Doudnabacteria bacterium RIFCSPHIGHO2_02_FULL_42_25]|uniref:Glycosyl transferase n=1 Tax=Candidatus Doudnabacteria bacterium RIFCSPHIGHO2_01_FULL_41_86 TaxID=1817821 RepID=A0A1F5N8A7_9BACT|nr:MAG: hypothetical protein A2717_04525 [Candidatus Doudnabacteria bacterium RIFCSPHIGHO2_01_FULL_41_86]OGE75878.1 MAG: hypothetical protein A3K07_04120 [Candidatus Doudnabacteria bacterium RIFCSPHIGHO2_01_43_10]OGE86252.1 MAG: hypothetical protein A3E28_03880 [Candidatus Doudnabacteria bacterium RIFCSPHIGHO2_12_FULL_42_22]OGE87100.1 MAG: hypothetical protein A3C49_03545 [Candidatus Doudnabacteria bacterium RIFCSPHIGHO2_02_FULL_42_25]OGE92240.1 MAG: hypothetical protein A2895_04230 [Candidatus